MVGQHLRCSYQYLCSSSREIDSSMALPLLVIVYLLTQPHSLYLSLPANPDGRVYLEKGGEHTLWKKNRNNVDNCNTWQYGVDPNRNFPFKWGECDDSMQTCSTSSQCESVVYRGHGPKSEVETKAILEYAASIFPTGQRKGGVNFQKPTTTLYFPSTSKAYSLMFILMGNMLAGHGASPISALRTMKGLVHLDGSLHHSMDIVFGHLPCLIVNVSCCFGLQIMST